LFLSAALNIRVSATGELQWDSRTYRCALGRGGVRADKREGDGATPSADFRCAACCIGLIDCPPDDAIAGRPAGA